MPLFAKVAVLALIQGFCELLPVSSSAHVIVAEKLLGLDPTSPSMTFLLVMLHTGTMLAVIGYFWHTWRSRYFSSASAFGGFARALVLATVCTGIVGVGLKIVIEHHVLHGDGAQVEELFGNTTLIALALAAVGVLIIVAGVRRLPLQPHTQIRTADAVWIGLVQGLCLPFRGFSRSGATISTGMFRDIEHGVLENFSFALAVVLTPVVIAREAQRLVHSAKAGAPLSDSMTLSLAGMALSFVAGWLALKWLSSWIERGRWHLFGYYCLAAAAFVYWIGR